MQILNTILPVFLIIGIGASLRRAGFFSSDFVTGLSRLTFWVGLPALLFYKIATAELDPQSAGTLYLMILFGMFCCIAAGFAAGKLLKLQSEEVGVLTQGAFRGNLVYVGLPIVLYSLSGNGQGYENMESLAVIVIALTVPVYNIVAVIVLLAGKHKFDKNAIGKMLRGIVTNPLLLACVAGLVYSMLFENLQPIIQRTLSSVGQMALPLALLCIGATLVQEKLDRKILPASVTGSLIKAIIAPAAGLLIAGPLGVDGAPLRIGLLLLSCPAAVASHIMAEQMTGAKNLSASIVVISTLLSIISFSLVLGYF
jgi:hypothetical protein